MTILDELPLQGISFLLTNQRAVKYSWRVQWIKQKCFVD